LSGLAGRAHLSPVNGQEAAAFYTRVPYHAQPAPARSRRRVTRHPPFRLPLGSLISHDRTASGCLATVRARRPSRTSARCSQQPCTRATTSGLLSNHAIRPAGARDNLGWPSAVRLAPVWYGACSREMTITCWRHLRSVLRNGRRCVNRVSRSSVRDAQPQAHLGRGTASRLQFAMGCTKGAAFLDQKAEQRPRQRAQVGCLLRLQAPELLVRASSFFGGERCWSVPRHSGPAVAGLQV
jgi:hypothetical protein